jgi:hypothetical protein
MKIVRLTTTTATVLAALALTACGGQMSPADIAEQAEGKPVASAPATTPAAEPTPDSTGPYTAPVSDAEADVTGAFAEAVGADQAPAVMNSVKAAQEGLLGHARLLDGTPATDEEVVEAARLYVTPHLLADPAELRNTLLITSEQAKSEQAALGFTAWTVDADDDDQPVVTVTTTADYKIDGFDGVYRTTRTQTFTLARSADGPTVWDIDYYTTSASTEITKVGA